MQKKIKRFWLNRDFSYKKRYDWNMKNWNILFIKLLLYAIFIFKVKNTSFTKKWKIIVENAQNNVFVIFIFFKKNVANILLKDIAIDRKKYTFKNLILI